MDRVTPPEFLFLALVVVWPLSVKEKKMSQIFLFNHCCLTGWVSNVLVGPPHTQIVNLTELSLLFCASDNHSGVGNEDGHFDYLGIGDCDRATVIVMVVIAGSTMGTTVEELKREVGKLKGHILSQVPTNTLKNDRRNSRDTLRQEETKREKREKKERKKRENREKEREKERKKGE